MITNNFLMPGLEIRFDQETQVVESMHGVRKPDRSWKHFDKAGHAHTFDGEKLPTLKWVKTGVGYYDDGTTYSIGEHRCRVCDETVEPQYTHSYEPQYVTGPPRYTLVLGGEEYPLADDDVGPLIEIMRRCGVIK